MANRFTPLEDNDNIVDAVNQIATEISGDINEIKAVVGEQQPAIANANVDNSDAGAKINAILAAMREHGLIAS